MADWKGGSGGGHGDSTTGRAVPAYPDDSGGGSTTVAVVLGAVVLVLVVGSLIGMALARATHAELDAVTLPVDHRHKKHAHRGHHHGYPHPSAHAPGHAEGGGMRPAPRRVEEVVPATAPAPRHTVSVLSYNVWGHYVVGGTDVAGRLRALVEHVVRAGFDIVLMQELFVARAGTYVHSDWYLTVAKPLAQAGWRYCTDPRASLPQLYLQNSGLAIFSRHPIVAVTCRIFPVTAEPFNSKGVIVVSIDVGGQLFHVANLHTDARNATSREAQLKFAATVVKEHIAAEEGGGGGDATTASTAPKRLIVAGDMNVCSQFEANNRGGYRTAVSAFADIGAPVDLFPGFTVTAGGERVIHPTYLGEKHSQGPMCLDHMFVSPDLAAAVSKTAFHDYTTAAGVPVSDHRGISAEFRLAPPTTQAVVAGGAASTIAAATPPAGGAGGVD